MNTEISYADAVSINNAKIIPNLENTPPKVDNLQNGHHPLRAIPPKKQIFVSRLASNTTVEDVDFYIKNIIGQNSDISIYKFSFAQPRTISSFKLTVPLEIFETLLEPNFWPINTMVREYIFRPNQQNIAVLPQNNSSGSKN